MKQTLPTCAVLLAGGRGTRFWPRSRMRTPKQLLDITGSETMIEATASRLRPLIAPKHIWAVTNSEQAAAVRRELHGVPASQVLAEPVGRNTAAAIGLAAVHLAHKHGDALMAVLPSDHHIGDAPRYLSLVRAALEQARTPGNLVVLGIPPTRPDTGFGYIERGGTAGRPRGVAAYAVKRFTEKPALPVARRYVASQKYLWNAGMFFWRVSTFLDNLKAFLPKTYESLGEIADAIGTKKYPATLKRIYGKIENISVDYAIMEPATKLSLQGLKPGGFSRAGMSRLKPRPPKRSGGAGVTAWSRAFVIPARVGWSDIGSWAAVHELHAAEPGANVSAGAAFTHDANGNYFWSPGKLVAAIGVHNLVVVDTDDALLVCARDRSQDVGKIVKWLEEQKRVKLL